jgi:type II secretory pathway component PulF
MSTFVRKIFFARGIRAEVWQMLADLTGTGMELGRALDLVARTFANRSPGVRGVVLDLRKSLASDRFKEVVRKYVPESEALIFSKFGSVNDADLFRAAARISRVEAEIQKAIVSAIIKPAFLLLIMVVLLYFLGKDFYPVLMLVAPMETWPDSWRFVAHIAMWVAGNPLMLFVYILITYALYKVVQKGYVGPFRRQLDKIPPFSLYRLSVGATFTFVILENAAVGNSINSGLLRALSKDASAYGRSRIMAIAKHISSKNIGAATIEAGQNFPDPELNAVLEAYCEQKDWVDNFRKYAETWLRRLEAKVKAAVAVLNIILLIIAAAFIAVVGRTIFGIINIIN